MAINDVGKYPDEMDDERPLPATVEEQYYTAMDQIAAYGGGGQQQQPQGYDPWYGKPTSNMTERIVEEILFSGLPEDNASLANFVEMYRAEIERLIRTPNLDMQTVREIRRDTEDLMDRAFSEGRRNVTRSKMLKHLKFVASLSACGEKPLTGLTGISAIITQKSVSEQSVKFPQQKQEIGFLSSLNPFRRH